MKFDRRFRFALIFSLVLLASLLASRAPEGIARFDFGKLSERAFSRLPKGKLLPTSEPFRASPFLVDLNLKTSTDLTFFEKPSGNQVHGPTSVTVRVYAEGPAHITIAVQATAPGASPRLFVYDDAGHLIQAPLARLTGEGYQYGLTIPAAGLYLLKAAFRLEQVDRMRLSAVLQKKERELVEYVRGTMKAIHLRIAPGQLRRLSELRAIQEARWAANEGKPRPYSLPTPKERVVGRVRSAGGAWALASIGLAGRNAEHRSDLALPSLDIRVMSGELPYGLSHFKLYLLASKNYGADLVMESLLADFGVLHYPSDLTNVSLNESSVSPMLLMETVEASYFELVQRNEGPVVGYDADALIEDAGKSHYVFESQYKKKSYPPVTLVKISDPTFAKRLCRDQWLAAFSFSMMFNGLHGLGQTDLKYHDDPTSDCHAPMVKDFNTNVGAVPMDGSDASFFHALRALGTLSPAWRPDVTTFSSYFSLVDAEHRKRDDFFWWNTMPATLNFFSDPENYQAFVEWMGFWSSPLSYQRVQTRMENFDHAAAHLETRRLGELGPTFRKVVSSYALKSDRNAGVSDLIRRSSRGESDPAPHEISGFLWRNETLMALLGKAGSSEGSSLHRGAPENLITFLYRHELSDRAAYYFLERNLSSNRSHSELVLSAGSETLRPKEVLESGSIKRVPEMWEIYLNHVAPEERVRVHRFVLRKGDDYRYLGPKVFGSTRYLGPDALALAPRSSSPKTETPVPARLTSFFDVEGEKIAWRDSAQVVSSALEIPRGHTWVIDRPTELRFSREGCLVVRGRIQIGPQGSLQLHADVESWSGLHFHDTDDMILERVFVGEVGHGKRTVTCGGRTYTGGVSVFDSTIELRESRIVNSRVEDAIHLLRSAVRLHGVQVTTFSGDGIDSDFSSLTARNLSVTCGESVDGGDGLDVSGSHAEVDSAQISRCKDKNISVGERAWLKLRGSRLSDGEVGIAVKDNSYADVDSTEISGNRIGITTYVKKPVFASPMLHVGPGVTLFANAIAAQRGD